MILCGLVMLAFYLESKTERAVITESQRTFLDVCQAHLADLFDPIVKDLKHLAGTVEGSLAATGSGVIAPRGLRELRQRFMAFAGIHHRYDQIRFIDHSGMEIIRINHVQGRPVAVPEAGLQKKGHRYYFNDTLELQRGEIFVSPLDLNVEKMKIEEPYKPMIRIGTPVFDSAGRKRGVVMINYLAAHMLAQLNHMKLDPRYLILLINTTGHYLKGPSPDLEWGFMFKEKRHLTLAAGDPPAWEVIGKSTHGQFETAKGLYTFTTIQPLGPAFRSSTGSSRPKGASDARLAGGQYNWKLVSLVPRPLLSARRDYLLKWVLALMVIITVGSGWLARHLAVSRLRRRAWEADLKRAHDLLESRVRERTKELAETNRRLREEIKERRETQFALSESEQKYGSMMQAMEDAAYICSKDYRISYMNPAMRKMIGRNAQGEPCHKALYHSEKKCAWCSMDTVQRGKNYSIQLVHPMSGRFYHISNDPIFHADGTISKLTIYRDLTEQKAAKEALRATESNYRRLIETMREGLVVLDQHGRLAYFNDRFTEILGRDRIVLDQGHYSDFLDKNNRHLLCRNLSLGRHGLEAPFELRWLLDDGSTVLTLISPATIWDDDGEYAGCLGVVSDITELRREQQERKKLEAHLQQAQKMEAIGTLAGGIAHDFNNILGAIIGYGELAEDMLPDNDPTRFNIKQILKAASRATDLVRQILSFSRQTTHAQAPVKLVPAIDEALKLLRASTPANIDIKWEPREDEGSVECDPIQLQQVMMNLITNAVHAMSEKGGILTVEVCNMDLTHQDSKRFGNLEPGAYKRITISDTGTGIPEEVRHRIFDPFFTTKDTGKGTGLGLSVVHGIVKNIGGSIHMYSEPGSGTTFQIYLPLVADEVLEQWLSGKSPLPTGHERILFVDDEEALADIGFQLLSALGYQVTAMTSSLDALKLLRQRPDDFDLIISDQNMPHMNGSDLAKEAMQIRPDIPIIVCSGFSEQLNEEIARDIGIRRFLMKPLVSRDVALVVREVLDTNKPTVQMRHPSN